MLKRLLPDPERPTPDDIAMSRPFFLILYLVMAGGYLAVLLSDASLREPARLALFTALMLAQGALYWLSESRTTFRRRWLAYFVGQGALTFAIGLLTHGHWLILALYMALMGQAAGMLWPNLRAIALTVFICLGLLTLNLIVSWGLQEFVQFLPLIGPMLAFVLTYVVLFVRQAEARERAQALLRELEAAHRQLQEYAARVEELTVSRERQRMAQELHDTLAQGLAGLILQLEAADSHLESGNPARAQAVIQQAMQRARTTLHEARRAIHALRPTALEQGSLIDALGREVDQFAATTGLRTTFDVDADSLVVPPEVAQDILRIVQESLSNVARHARASHVLVRLAQSSEGFQVLVQDDGVGFDPAEGLERPGCFGLAGMQERAQRVGGVLRVESAPGRGTRVVLEIGETVRRMEG